LTGPLHHCSTQIIYVSPLPGQTGKVCEPSKKQRSFRKSGSMVQKHNFLWFLKSHHTVHTRAAVTVTADSHKLTQAASSLTCISVPQDQPTFAGGTVHQTRTQHFLPNPCQFINSPITRRYVTYSYLPNTSLKQTNKQTNSTCTPSCLLTNSVK
jgi:hypothetical protein